MFSVISRSGGQIIFDQCHNVKYNVSVSLTTDKTRQYFFLEKKTAFNPWNASTIPGRQDTITSPVLQTTEQDVRSQIRY